MIRRFIADKRGASVVEYGLIIACLSLAMIGGFSKASDALAFLWGNNNSRLIQALSTDEPSQ